jgi:hypothetical protein
MQLLCWFEFWDELVELDFFAGLLMFLGVSFFQQFSLGSGMQNTWETHLPEGSLHHYWSLMSDKSSASEWMFDSLLPIPKT